MGELDSPESYDDFAALVTRSGVLTDPWLGGAPRLRARPKLLSADGAARLYKAAEDLALAYNEVGRLCMDEPDLLEAFFKLTPFQRAMWEASAPLWHGLARADAFETDEGVVFAELNSDTPTGEAEAVVLNEVVHPRHPGTVDPNAALGDTYCAMVEAVARRALGADFPRVAGLVYPTEFTEDLAVIRLFKGWFEARGYRVVLGSPYNLTLDERGRACLFDVPIAIMLRHYKTDWWGERESAWRDERLADEEALREPLAVALTAALEGKLCVVNPFGAVLPQNKRAMAFMWEHLPRFGPAIQDVIRRHVPPTFRLEVMERERLVAERREWVLKSDYGAEGDEVIVGRDVEAEEWAKCLELAREGRWVAQQFFEARPNADGEIENVGVFVIAGRASGLYTRCHKGATTDEALSVPTLIAPVTPGGAR